METNSKHIAAAITVKDVEPARPNNIAFSIMMFVDDAYRTGSVGTRGHEDYDKLIDCNSKASNFEKNESCHARGIIQIPRDEHLRGFSKVQVGEPTNSWISANNQRENYFEIPLEIASTPKTSRY